MICRTCINSKLAKAEGMVHCTKYLTSDELKAGTGDSNLYIGWFSANHSGNDVYDFSIYFDCKGVIHSELDTCKYWRE